MATIFDINIHEFAKRFNSEYNFLYDTHCSGGEVAGEREAVAAFDSFLEKNSDFVCEFNGYRGDIILSDREAAAFMFALSDMID